MAALFTCLLWSSLSATAQQESTPPDDPKKESEGTDEDGYVELFDPGKEDPQEPPTRPLPQFPLEADEHFGSDEDEQKPDEPMFPWDRAPRRVPDRLLAPEDLRDPRSVELFYYGCADELHRRDVTLFANGTLRLRSGPRDAQEMKLEELGPTELRQHLNQLLRIRSSRDFPDQLRLKGSLDGRWVGSCRYSLDLPGFQPIRLQVGSFDVLPLELRQLQQYADELAEMTRPLVAPDSLGPNYVPEIGDVLRTHEGEIYRVRGRTSDGRALELESLDGNWRIFVPEDELTDVFAALEVDLRSPRGR
ncbi:MAG: hypothetical protein MPN21_17950 [Thermoanaerobaculia bacterium]|nr:hypothetical protein [Thermoanaerobaculia bacterium]